MHQPTSQPCFGWPEPCERSRPESNTAASDSDHISKAALAFLIRPSLLTLFRTWLPITSLEGRSSTRKYFCRMHSCAFELFSVLYFARQCIIFCIQSLVRIGPLFFSPPRCCARLIKQGQTPRNQAEGGHGPSFPRPGQTRRRRVKKVGTRQVARQRLAQRLSASLLRTDFFPSSPSCTACCCVPSALPTKLVPPNSTPLPAS